MNDDLKPINPKDILKKLQVFSGWAFADNKIRKEYVFDSFSEGVDFIKKLTPFFNQNDHHPDIHIYYKKIVFELQTFSVGGKVTLMDFTVASKIEKTYKKFRQYS